MKSHIRILSETFAGFCLLATAAFFSSCSVKPAPDPIALKWDSIGTRLGDVNAMYAAYIKPDGTILEYRQGKTAQGADVNENTLFEGASISKTYFSYIFWNQLIAKNINADSISIPRCGEPGSLRFSPYELLSHTVQLPTDSCVAPVQHKGAFSYSENCYLAMQKNVEKRLGKDLQQLAKEIIFKPNGLQRSSFLWDSSNTNYVDGYYNKKDLHRPIHKYDKPAANGTVYLTGKELIAFVKKLMNSRELDSMQVPFVKVQEYPNLEWGRGIGIETNKGTKYCWQWASNWSFNSFLLIDMKNKSAIICLTNTMSGPQIRSAYDWLLDTKLQAFQLISW